jgi:outer membrane protein assembly factor BamB
MRTWLLIPTLLTLASPAFAGDWPQWLGPNRDGSTTEIVKPWSGSPKVLWRAKVGDGHSSPVVGKGHVVFLHHFLKEGDKNLERLTAFDGKTGTELDSVSHERGPFSSMFGVGPRATPLIHDGSIYTLGVTGRLCREEAWSTTQPAFRFKTAYSIDTLKEYGANNLFFGVSGSPLIEGENVLLATGGGKIAPLVALNKETGKLAWKVDNQPASYAAPIVFGEGKSRQAVFLGQLGLTSINPKDGELFWQFPFKDKLIESSTTPVKVGELLIVSSVTQGSVALKLTEENGKPAVKEVWREPKLTCYFSTPVPAGDGLLFMVTGMATLQNASITLHCVEAATGKVKWSKEKIGKYHAAIVRTGDGKLLMLDDGGRLTLMEPNAKEYKELARSKVCRETWAHPALSNGRLYIRDDKEIICLQMD